MRRILIAIFVVAAAPSVARADGCYICRDKSNTYVKFVGDDTPDKRRQAEACGCNVGGTAGSCYAANLTVLCTVSQAPVRRPLAPAMCMP